MPEQAIQRYYGRFESLDGMKAALSASGQNPPSAGDNAELINADGSVSTFVWDIPAGGGAFEWVERGQLKRTPSGAYSLAGPLVAKSVVVAEAPYRPLRRIAIMGDSIASSGSAGGFLEMAIMACGGQLARVVNAAVAGNTWAQMEARFDADITPFAPDEVWISGGMNSTELTAANKAAVASMVAKSRAMGARPVIFGVNPRTATPTAVEILNNWLRAFCAANGVEFAYLWDGVFVQATGATNAAALDALGIHPLPAYAWDAGSVYGNARVQAADRRSRAGGLATNSGTSQNSWVIDPFNTTGDASKGSRWTADNAKVTFSKVATSSPDIGVWQRMDVALTSAAGDNSGATILAPGGMLIPSGSEIEISYRIKTTDLVNLTIDCYVELQNDSLADVGGGRKSFLSALRANVDGTVCYILKVPANTYRPQIKFKFTQTTDATIATGKIDVGMIAIRSLAL